MRPFVRPFVRFAEQNNDGGMDQFAKLLSYVTFIRVSRRAGSALFATDNLLRRGKFSLSLVGFDTSLSA